MLSADSCSFLFSIYLSSAFFVFRLITYDWSVQTHLLLLLWLLLLQECAGCMWVCVGVLGCRQQRVYVDVRGYTRVCAGVRSVDRCVQVCAGVCKSALVSASVCVGWILRNIYWRIESLHQRTLIRILYEFFRTYTYKKTLIMWSKLLPFHILQLII